MKDTKVQKYGMDLTKGPILKSIILFTLPAILTNFLQQLYITFGLMIVGNFEGKTALAAIGSTTSLTNMMLYFFIGLSVGATVTCARYYGAGDKKMLDKAVHTSIMTALISGVILAFMGLFVSKLLLQAMSTDAKLLDSASNYMRVYFLGSPFLMLYNFGAGILRASGDTKRPLYILAFSGLVNIGSSLFFVCVCGLGVVGAALGTVMSQLFSAVMVLMILIRSDNEFALRIKDIRFHKEPFLCIIRVGIPSGINSMLFSLANLFLQSQINLYDDAYVAGSSAGTSVENFIFLAMNAVEQAVVTCVGQNYGAKKYKRIDKIVGASFLIGTIVTVVLALGILWKTEFLLSLFNGDAEVINAGKIRLDLVCKTCLLYLPNILIPGALKGMDRSTLPTILNIIFVCATRIAWIMFVYPQFSEELTDKSFLMIFMCFPVSWLLSTLAQATAYVCVRLNINKRMKNNSI